MKSFTFAALAMAVLVAATSREAGAQPSSLQADMEVHTSEEVGASVRAGQRLDGGDARVRVRVVNVDDRTVSVHVRLRYATSNPLALDFYLDSIDVRSVLSYGFEIGRSDLQLHDTNLSTNAQILAYRVTLYRIQNGPATVRVKVYGYYLQ